MSLVRIAPESKTQSSNCTAYFIKWPFLGKLDFFEIRDNKVEIRIHHLKPQNQNSWEKTSLCFLKRQNTIWLDYSNFHWKAKQYEKMSKGWVLWLYFPYHTECKFWYGCTQQNALCERTVKQNRTQRTDVSEINSTPILFIQLLNSMFIKLQTQFVLYS